MFYFLKPDLEILDKEIQEAKAKIFHYQKEMGDSVEQSSETWHDNFGYEEGRRQVTVWSNRLSDLMYIKSKVELLEPPTDTIEVKIGHRVRLKDLETNQELEIKISSYMSQEEGEVLNVSYTTPLAMMVIGARINERRTGKIGDKQKSFEIIEIK